MPKASPIVTAIVRCNGSILPLVSIALDTSILGDGGQVIRIIQVSQDSWCYWDVDMTIVYQTDVPSGKIVYQTPVLVGTIVYQAHWSSELDDAQCRPEE
jgi:hypothetical protein